MSNRGPLRKVKPLPAYKYTPEWLDKEKKKRYRRAKKSKKSDIPVRENALKQLSEKPTKNTSLMEARAQFAHHEEKRTGVNPFDILEKGKITTYNALNNILDPRLRREFAKELKFRRGEENRQEGDGTE
jgi:hypothetical protein